MSKRAQQLRCDVIYHKLAHVVTDVTTDWLCVEYKHRRALPAWLTDSFSQAANDASCKRDNLDIIVLHEEGKRHDADLVVIRLKDWQEWFGDVKVSEENEE